MTSLQNMYGYSYRKAKRFLELLEKSDKQKYNELMRLWEERTKVIRSQKAKMNAIDESVFDNFSQEMAYWLGMIASDGCVNKKTNKISINCKAEDSSHLIAFKNFLKYSGNIKYRDAKIKDKAYPSAYIEINSLHIKQKLPDYGIVPAKSNLDVDYLSYIPDEFKFAFICGYFDGDGCINSGKAKRISILGNRSFCNSVSSFLNSNKIVSHVNSEKNKWNVVINEYASLKKFCLVYLSFDERYLLKRKADISKKYVSFINESQRRKQKKKQESIKRHLCLCCGIPIQGSKTGLCWKCFVNNGRTKWPSKNELKNLICNYPMTQIGKMFGITDNAVRKRCKAYGLPYKSKEIKEFELKNNA